MSWPNWVSPDCLQNSSLKLIGEEVAEFEYKPVACEKAYRVVVLRKKLVVEKGQLWLFQPGRYFFYITNDLTTPASGIVFLANDRCDQENLIAQLKGGVRALAMPVGDLVRDLKRENRPVSWFPHL